jgi:hypothetical protein
VNLEELSARYGIPVSGLKSRIKILGGSIDKELSAEFLDRLDSLNRHLKSGGTASEFLEMAATPTNIVSIAPEGSELTLAPQRPINDFLSAEYAVAMRNRLDLLQACSDNSWELPTSALTTLLGERPRNSEGWRRFGFTFTRNGSHGRESSWLISR